MVFELSTCDWITRCVLMPGIKSLIVYNNNAAVEDTDVFIEETSVNNADLPETETLNNFVIEGRF